MKIYNKTKQNKLEQDNNEGSRSPQLVTPSAHTNSNVRFVIGFFNRVDLWEIKIKKAYDPLRT